MSARWPGRRGIVGGNAVAAMGAASARVSAWKTNWCTPRASRKRTSVLAGWTLTSTAGRIELEEQHVGRVARAVQHVGVGLAGGVGEQLVADETAIDEEELLVARRLRIGGQGGVAGQQERPGRRFHRAHARGEVRAE